MVCFFIDWKNFLLNSLFQPFSPFLKCFVLVLMLNLLSIQSSFVCVVLATVYNHCLAWVSGISKNNELLDYFKQFSSQLLCTFVKTIQGETIHCKYKDFSFRFCSIDLHVFTGVTYCLRTVAISTGTQTKPDLNILSVPLSGYVTSGIGALTS